jgi:hypothetical protein
VCFLISDFILGTQFTSSRCSLGFFIIAFRVDTVAVFIFRAVCCFCKEQVEFIEQV